MKQIFILCNSAACLDELSSGRFPDLHTKDIFTCNNAFTFFRTSGRHLNFVSDMSLCGLHEIKPDILKPWGGYDHIEFIYSVWDQIQQVGKVLYNTLKYSTVCVGASSAINALFYLNAVEKYDEITLIGYTINEWDGMDKFPNLLQKKLAFDEVFKNYSMEKIRQYTYKFSRK